MGTYLYQQWLPTYIHLTILSRSYLHPSHNIVPVLPTSMSQYCPGLTYIHLTIYCPGHTYIHLTILSRSYLHPSHSIVPVLLKYISQYCPGCTGRTYIHPGTESTRSQYCPSLTYIHLTILSWPPMRALAVLIAHVVAVSHTTSTIAAFQGAWHVSCKNMIVMSDVCSPFLYVVHGISRICFF